LRLRAAPRRARCTQDEIVLHGAVRHSTPSGC